MTIVILFMRIVSLSDVFHRDSVGHVEANIINLTSSLGPLTMAFIKDCWKPWFVKVTRMTLSVPHSTVPV